MFGTVNSVGFFLADKGLLVEPSDLLVFPLGVTLREALAVADPRVGTLRRTGFAIFLRNL